MVIMTGNEEQLSLEELALRRKDRLKNLKRKADSSQESSESTSGQEKLALPKPQFRSYKPQDETLQETMREEAKPANVDDEVKDLIEAAKDKVVVEDLDITTLAPRKPDWDLKRDVAKKLEKLERKTQKAIAELIWERLKQGEKDNIGAIVTMTENKANDDE